MRLQVRLFKVYQHHVGLIALLYCTRLYAKSLGTIHRCNLEYTAAVMIVGLL